MRYYTLAAAALAASLASPLIGSASAQSRISEGTMTRCNQQVGQMKFDGWPADRNREMMMLACTHNDGTIPGAQTEVEQKPVSLRQHKLQRQRTAPGG